MQNHKEVRPSLHAYQYSDISLNLPILQLVLCHVKATIARLTQYSDFQNLDYRPLEYGYEYGICCM